MQSKSELQEVEAEAQGEMGLGALKYVGVRGHVNQEAMQEDFNALIQRFIGAKGEIAKLTSQGWRVIYAQDRSGHYVGFVASPGGAKRDVRAKNKLEITARVQEAIRKLQGQAA